jgi:hypothetical protein
VSRFVFLFATLMSIAPAAVADDAAAPNVLATMVWSGSAAGSQAAEAAAQTARGCGSIVACVGEVARRIGEVGAGDGTGTSDQGSGNASATFVVQIEGQAVRRESDYRLSLAVIDKRLVVTPNTPADKRTAIEAEARGVLRALAAWNRTTTPEETKILDAPGRLDRALPEPFAPLQLLTKPTVNVTFFGKAKTPTPPRLVFKSDKTNTLGTEETITEIPYFTQFWILAYFDEDQAAATKTLTLKWPGGDREVQAMRVSPRVYKSSLLIAVPPEETRTPGGGGAAAAAPQ